MFKNILLSAAALSGFMLCASQADAHYGYGYSYGFSHYRPHYSLLLLSAAMLLREPPRDHRRLGRLFLRVRLSHRLSRLPGLQLLNAQAASRLGQLRAAALSP